MEYWAIKFFWFVLLFGAWMVVGGLKDAIHRLNEKSLRYLVMDLIWAFLGYQAHVWAIKMLFPSQTLFS